MQSRGLYKPRACERRLTVVNEAFTQIYAESKSI